MTIFEYAKRNKLERALILRKQAQFIDEYTDSTGERIFVYYLNGFFIEAITNVGVIIDVLPYKRGYKADKKELDKNVIKERAFKPNFAA